MRDIKLVIFYRDTRAVSRIDDTSIFCHHYLRNLSRLINLEVAPLKM